MIRRQWLLTALLLALVIVVAACNSNNDSKPSVTPNGGTTAGNDNKAAEEQKETIYIEVAGNTGDGTFDLEKDDPWVQRIVEKTGVGYTSQYVPWDGGNGYAQRLNTRIAG